MIPALDTVSWRELSKYLSAHLLNTQLHWPLWQPWGEDYASAVELECNGDQKLFLDLLLDRITRSSVPDKIKRVVSASMHSAIPESGLSSFAPSCPLFDFSTPSNNGEISGLRTVAGDILVRLSKRESPEVLLEWLEGPHDGVDEVFQSEGWRASLCVSAILVSGANKGGGTLSSVMGLVDRYRDTLRELVATSENCEQVVLQSLMEALVSQPSHVNILLDAFLRRGILQASEAVKWLIKDKDSSSSLATIDISTLGTNNWLWAFLETAVDRSLDIVRAAVKLRNKFAADSRRVGSMEVEASTDNDANGAGKDMSGTRTMVVQGKAPTALEEQRRQRLTEETAAGKEYNDEDDDEAGDDNADNGRENDNGNEEDRDYRRRRFESTENTVQNTSDTALVAPSVVQQIPDHVMEAVTNAARGCREIYSLLTSTVLVAMSRKWSGLAEVNPLEAALDPFIVTGVSLIMRLMRAYRYSEQSLMYSIEKSGGLFDGELKFSITDFESVSRLVESHHGHGVPLIGPSIRVHEWLSREI